MFFSEKMYLLLGMKFDNEFTLRVRTVMGVRVFDTSFFQNEREIRIVRELDSEKSYRDSEYRSTSSLSLRPISDSHAVLRHQTLDSVSELHALSYPRWRPTVSQCTLNLAR